LAEQCNLASVAQQAEDDFQQRGLPSRWADEGNEFTAAR